MSVAKPALTHPEHIRARLVAKYQSQRSAWLVGDGTWPLEVPLAVPTEAQVASDPTAVRAWVTAWRNGSAAVGDVRWEDRAYPRLGAQQFPTRVCWASAEDVARCLREGARWQRARARYAALRGLFPQAARLHRPFDVLADYSDFDFERLVRLLVWLQANPASGLYLRQLPVEGLDTKWVESRKALVAEMLRDIRGLETTDFFEVTGLVAAPARLRMRLLCPQLRVMVGGLCDFEVPVTEAAALPVRPARAVIVENLATGLALPDLPGTVALMKLGHAVEPLTHLSWLAGIPVVYWGDIDTHGLVILARVRKLLPQTVSVLMDEATLLAHRELWVTEAKPHAAERLELFTAAERSIYERLKANHWGHQVRLEQERIGWPYALGRLADCVQPPITDDL